MYVEVVYFSLLRTHTTQDSCRVFIDCTFHGLILYNVFIICDASCFFLWTKLPALCFVVMKGSKMATHRDKIVSASCPFVCYARAFLLNCFVSTRTILMCVRHSTETRQC